jgi:hypothetical protein
MRASPLIAALLLGACVTPRPQIVGPYASRLSEADIEQIKLIVRNDRGITDHRISKLDVLRPDKVRVETGGVRTDEIGPESHYVRFFVVKRNGKWVDAPSLGAEAESQRSIMVN